MKKLTVFFVIGAFILSLWMASPAAAYSGVQGRAFDSNGQPWVHGGQVLVYNQTTGQLVASGNLVTGDPTNNGRFNFPYTQTTHGGNGIAPLQGHNLTIYVSYNSGGTGTPAIASHDYIEITIITGRYNAGNFNTNTGPTAVSLSAQHATTTHTSTTLLVALALVLGSASYIALRQRHPQA